MSDLYTCPGRGFFSCPATSRGAHFGPRLERADASSPVHFREKACGTPPVGRSGSVLLRIARSLAWYPATWRGGFALTLPISLKGSFTALSDGPPKASCRARPLLSSRVPAASQLTAHLDHCPRPRCRPRGDRWQAGHARVVMTEFNRGSSGRQLPFLRCGLCGMGLSSVRAGTCGPSTSDRRVYPKR